MTDSSLPLTITLPAVGTISGLLDAPKSPTACYVMAHGAGAGMTHEFLTHMAGGLARRGIATLRYQFPYMEQGSRRPDSPAIAHAAVRAAVAEAARRVPGVPLFAGGKSFGGRMTSQAQAAEPLHSVRGLVFLGFPLHPAGKPAVARAAHLTAVQLPMLFLQGTRDALADMDLMRQLTSTLGTRATLFTAEGADHSFHVLKRSGGSDAEVREALMDTMARWMADRA